MDENGKVKSSQKSITVDKVSRFGLPAIVSRAIEQIKLADMLEKYKEDIDTILLMHLCAPSSISKIEHRYDEVIEAIEKKKKWKRMDNRLRDT